MRAGVVALAANGQIDVAVAHSYPHYRTSATFAVSLLVSEMKSLYTVKFVLFFLKEVPLPYTTVISPGGREESLHLFTT